MFLRSSVLAFPVGAALVSVSLGGCTTAEEPDWARFNADTDMVVVSVGAAEVLDPVSILLHSSSGQVEVGTATVTPGGGPIGTEHTLIVHVEGAFEDRVGRASVRTDSGSRGEDEYEMEPDSADEGLYSIMLVSVGETGEVRDDIFTVRLWYDQNAEEWTDEPADTSE